jgi:hypothetical protein
VRTLWCAITLSLPASGLGAAQSGAPLGVAPGARDAFAEIGDRCPTFSWAALPLAAGYELRVYAVDDLQRPGVEPAVLEQLPAGASSWTPAAEQCLERGERYAWALRTIGEGRETEWSEPLFLQVVAAPDELARMLEELGEVGRERLRRALLVTDGAHEQPEEPDRARADEKTDDPVSKRVAPRKVAASLAGAITGLRAHLAATSGQTYGVLGVVASPDGAGVRADNDGGGPDLVLGGAPVAALSETGLSRESASDVTFELSNPGAGSMTLLVDGAEVLTTASGGGDADTLDELDSAQFLRSDADDAMAAMLSLTGTGDFTLNIGASSHVNLGSSTRVYKDEALFLHDVGARNVGLGRVALVNVSSGAANTAIGYHAAYNDTVGSNNTAVGDRALFANTSGAYNTALGSQALRSNVDGIRNTATGFQALQLNTTGDNNTATGYAALAANTAGNFNTAMGVQALQANGTGSSNTAVGQSALRSNTSGQGNTAVGFLGLFANTTGADNTAVGRAALTAATASGNTAVGAYALDANTSGAGNTAVGSQALGSVTTVGGLTAVGSRALEDNTSGTENTAVGFFALASNGVGSDNTAVGHFSLLLNAGGEGNTAVGSSALLVNATGNQNTAVGWQALDSNTSASGNTALGALSLGATTVGGDNTAAGWAALFANTSGQGNTAVGSRALDANTTGNYGTAVGANALTKNTTATYNTAVGMNALADATTGGKNTAVGAVALTLNTTGHENTAIGFRAMSGNTTGYDNTAIGYNALQSVSADYDNVALGSGAMRFKTGDRNVAVGTVAFDTSGTGSHNTALGFGALRSGDGDRNVAVGSRAMWQAGPGSGNIAIGYEAGFFVEGSNNIRIGSKGIFGDSHDGRIEIGTAGTHEDVFIHGIWDEDDAIQFDTADVIVNELGELGITTSSRRFKEEIADLGAMSERILDLRPVSFRYKQRPDGDDDRRRPVEYGLIAEEVAETFPELVIRGRDGQPLTVKYRLLVPLLLGELQRQERELEAQGARIAALEELVAKLDEALPSIGDPPGISPSIAPAAGDNCHLER